MVHRSVRPICFDAISGALIHTFDDPTPTTADLFGHSVAIDGRFALIGATGDDTNGVDVGQAYLFDIVTGNHLLTFDDPTPTTSDWFGHSVAIDGNFVVIGAQFDDTNGFNVGQTYLFQLVPEPTAFSLAMVALCLVRWSFR